jgi:hypothetical protein
MPNSLAEAVAMTTSGASASAPLPRLKLHGLRPTIALLEGIDVYVVSDHLDRSSNPHHRQIYTHVTKPRQSEAAERVAARILRRP